jgi:hypothetical protein
MRRYPTLEIGEQMNALVAGYTPVIARAGEHQVVCRSSQRVMQRPIRAPLPRALTA